jgi:hypothetical protein
LGVEEEKCWKLHGESDTEEGEGQEEEEEEEAVRSGGMPLRTWSLSARCCKIRTCGFV